MDNESFIVICRDDRPNEHDPPGPYVLATRTVFKSAKRAASYARSISAAREPIIVSGRFSQLHFDDLARFGDSLDK